MAHLLANNPGQQDAGEILLSGFTQMALQMEAQRRLNMKPGSKPRRGKKGPKKQPQRGLGVAQLEKIRLEEQRRASQQLAALRQLHSTPPLFSSSNAAAMQAPAASIIPQLERESINHHTNSLMVHKHPAMSSSLAHFPCIDTIASSFLLNNASPLSSTLRPPSAPSAPLDLFPTEKFASSIKSSDGILADKSWPLRQVPQENRGFLDNPQNTLNFACDQRNEGHDHGSMSYSLLHMRRNCAPMISELRNSGQIHQVPSRMMASTQSPSLDRMVELSSFQSVAASSSSSRGGDELVAPKRWAWGGATQQPSRLLSELPMWTSFPSPASHSKTISHELENLCRRSEEECELTLRPPGTCSSVKGERSNETGSGGRGPHNFLSLSVGGTWQDSVADAGSSTPSPVSKTTTTTTCTAASTTSTTDEYTSPLATSMPCSNSFFSTKGYRLNEPQHSSISTCDGNMDLTLKL